MLSLHWPRNELSTQKVPQSMGMDRRSHRRILAVVRHPVGGVRTHILYTYPDSYGQAFNSRSSYPSMSTTTVLWEVLAWEGRKSFGCRTGIATTRGPAFGPRYVL